MSISEYKTRSGGYDYTYSEEQKVQWSRSGVVLGSDIQTRTVGADTSHFQGQDTPDYHSRVRKGELLPATNFWRFIRQGESTGTYSYNKSDGTQYRQVYGSYTPYTDWYIMRDELEAYAPQPKDLSLHVQAAAAKIYSSGYDALTCLAELASTRRMFLDCAKKLAHLDFPRNWRRLSSEWLEGRYGWRTLLYDLDDLSKALANFDESRSRYSERSGYRDVITLPTVETEMSWMAFYGLKKLTDQVTIEGRGCVTADIEVPKFQFNPLQTGWELIPFSFVIDWFIGVGQSLAALSFMAYQRKYAASIGYRITIERSFSFDTTSFKTGYSGDGVHQNATCKAILYTRFPSHVPLFPQPSLHINPYKIIDMIAMVLQRTRRR